jgi:hypothetical protein
MDGTMSRKLWEMVLVTMAMAMYSAGLPMPQAQAKAQQDRRGVIDVHSGSSPAIAPMTMPPMSGQ